MGAAIVAAMAAGSGAVQAADLGDGRAAPADAYHSGGFFDPSRLGAPVGSEPDLFGVVRPRSLAEPGFYDDGARCTLVRRGGFFLGYSFVRVCR